MTVIQSTANKYDYWHGDYWGARYGATEYTHDELVVARILGD